MTRQRTAACSTLDPDLWFPVGSSGPAVRQAEQAKTVCLNHCPLQQACLEYALSNGELHGVWGGATEQERQMLTRRRATYRRMRAARLGLQGLVQAMATPV